MSLVAYDNSGSDSETSDNEDRENGKVVIPEKPQQKDLFMNLPQPNVQNTVEEITEVEDEFLKKKEVEIEKPPKQKVKISVPLPSEFSDEEEDEGEKLKKKQKILSKSSGLFAILPPPKTQPITTKHFVPNSVKRNLTPRNITNAKKQKVDKKPQPKQTKEIIPEELESDDEDLKDIPDTFDEETWQKVCGKPKKQPKPVIKVTTEPVEEKIIEIAPEPVQSYQGLDNKAFKELVGANQKRKGQGNIKLVDINEEEILPDKDIWMAKALTDPEMSAKYVIKDPVNDTCRRKHHITYLAQQAKANEQELQNQWASNRFTRQKTQAKYGF